MYVFTNDFSIHGGDFDLIIAFARSFCPHSQLARPRDRVCDLRLCVCVFVYVMT